MCESKKTRPKVCVTENDKGRQPSLHNSPDLRGRTADATRITLLLLTLTYLINFVNVADKDSITTYDHNSIIAELIAQHNPDNVSTPSLNEIGMRNNERDPIVGTPSRMVQVTNGIPRHVCRYRLASRSKTHNSGLGILSTENIGRGDQVGPGSLDIKAADLNPYQATALSVLLSNYAWDFSETGGITKARGWSLSFLVLVVSHIIIGVLRSLFYDSKKDSY